MSMDRPQDADQNATVFAMNGLLTAFLLADSTAAGIRARVDIIEMVLLPMPAGYLRDTLFKTLSLHRKMVDDIAPGQSGRC